MNKFAPAVKERNFGYKLGNHKRYSLFYADDEKSNDYLLGRLCSFENTSGKYNIEISIITTNSMTISKELFRCKTIRER